MKKYLLLLFVCNNSFAWGWLGPGPFIPYGGFNYGFGYPYYSYPLIYPYPVYQQQPIIVQQNPQPIIIQSPPQTIIIERPIRNCPTCNYKEYDERFKRYQEK